MLSDFLQHVWGVLRRKTGFAPSTPIRTLDDYISYASEQAAFVSQVSLYGYIKTRAGTQWPKLFENETYLKSMKIARWHIFGASVADLALYGGARLVTGGYLESADAKDFSRRVIETILTDYEQNDISRIEFDEMIKLGLDRCDNADWHSLFEGGVAFQGSADALIYWTPIADELKDLDEDIVRNSIHMRWINIRQNIKERLDPEMVRASLGCK